MSFKFYLQFVIFKSMNVILKEIVEHSREIKTRHKYSSFTFSQDLRLVTGTQKSWDNLQNNPICMHAERLNLHLSHFFTQLPNELRNLHTYLFSIVSSRILSSWQPRRALTVLFLVTWWEDAAVAEEEVERQPLARGCCKGRMDV